MASLMYGAGLRLLECVELRVKDLNFDRGELTIRDGKGGKDRVTMLPIAMKGRLFEHVTRVKMQHEADLTAGRGSVALPGALRAKYPNAPTMSNATFVQTLLNGGIDMCSCMDVHEQVTVVYRISAIHGQTARDLRLRSGGPND